MNKRKIKREHEFIEPSISLTEGMVGCEPSELTGDTADGNDGEEEERSKSVSSPLSKQENCYMTINPFASIGRTGTSKGKVKVRDTCLNISFLT